MSIEMWGISLAGIGSIILWLIERDRRKKAEFYLSISSQKNEELPLLQSQLRNAELNCSKENLEKRIAEEKLQMLHNAQEELKNVFRSLSADALEKNNKTFIDLAKATLEKFQEGAKGDLEKRQIAISELLNPMKESLTKLDQGIREIEKERKGDQEALKEQVKSLLENEKQLKRETSNLVKALRSPLARGRWGEIQLRRVVELAGMLNHCDFFEQQQESMEENRYRPDLIVKLPGGRQVIVDSKVPLECYLEAIQEPDEEIRMTKFKGHARQVRAHILSLSKKSYWERFQPSPEFVILFLPAETFFSTALEFDPSLIEVGAQQKVIIATPTTLIALLRAVAYGWQQENLTRHVEALHSLGQDLYKRLADMSSHFAKMGRGLNSAIEAYNKGVGSLESRVLVTARKFSELDVISGQIEIETMEKIDKIPREIQDSVYSESNLE